MNRRGIAGLGVVPFNGSFATLFPGAYQVVQTDRGLTYGATPLATTGNTSTTALTLSGTIAGPYVPILVKAENTAAVAAGASFRISFDGGSTFAITGLVPLAAGGPVALTGAGTGLLIAWAAGGGVVNDTWTATAAGLADQQTGNPINNYSQATATKQPIVTVGLNGHAGIAGGTAAQTRCMLSSLAIPKTTTPVMCLVVARALAWTSNARLLGETSPGIGNHLGILQFNGVTPQISQYDNVFGNGDSSLAINSWGAIEAGWGNATTDYLKLGSAAPVTGANCGVTASDGTGRELFSNSGGTGAFGNYELLMLVYCSPRSTVAARAAITAFYGGSVAV